MKNLLKWQFISMVSRGIAMLLGIVQSFFIVRILTVGEYGLVQLAVAIGGAFGIYQHLGLASGSTREISSAERDSDIFKIFLTSIFIRYLVTIPLAIGLFFGANYIATQKYGHPEIVIPLQIYSIVMVIQAVQSMLNSVIAGTKKFKTLFIYQAAIAVVSVIMYIPFVYYFRINGFFYALLAFNFISSIVLGVLAFYPLRDKLKFPTKKEFRFFFKELLSISLGIYLVKIIFTFWEKSGPLILGFSISPEAIGVFSFALLYARKILHASDAITDINLPVFSEKFVNNVKEFKPLFIRNFNAVFSLLLFSSFTAVFWSSEVIRFVVGGHKYDASLGLIIPMMMTFIFYSFVNVIKSSVFVPGKFIKEMIIGYVLMLALTVLGYFGLNNFGISAVLAMTLSLCLGSFSSFAYLSLYTEKKLNMKFLTHDHFLILFQVLIIMFTKDLINSVFLKILVYIAFVAFYFMAVYIAKFVTKKDLDFFLKKLSIGSKK